MVKSLISQPQKTQCEFHLYPKTEEDKTPPLKKTSTR